MITPTNSKKTLTTFLYTLDRLFHENDENTHETHKHKTSHILYISPIKTLNTDIQRNLQIPLKNITDKQRRRNETKINLHIKIHTNDTPTQKHNKLTHNPPNILITTPKSLYLILTSHTHETLHDVETIIIDKIHTITNNKHNTHLTLNLKQLDTLLHTSTQRINLSTTIHSTNDITTFLNNDHPITIINPPTIHHPQIQIIVPIANIDNISSIANDTDENNHTDQKNSI